MAIKLLDFAYLHLMKYSNKAKTTIFQTELKIFVSALLNLYSASKYNEKLFENKLLTKMHYLMMAIKLVDFAY